VVTGYLQRSAEKFEDLRLIRELEGLEALAKTLRSDLNKGLSGQDAAERRIFFGTNMRPLPETRGFCRILWDVLGDPLLRVLFFCGIISIILNEATEEDKDIGKF
jgi:hypothetical protein